MNKEKFNPIDYKKALRQEWDMAAEGWEKWWDTIEKGSQKVSARLIELAEVKKGGRVLDIATGLGEPTVSAAVFVGPSGHVTAIDLSPRMLELARKRAESLGIRNIDSFEMDGEVPGLGDDSFDAVLCRWGLMFFPDPTNALIVIRRLLKTGGRLAAAGWAAPENVPMISLAMNVVSRELKLPPPPADKPTPFSLADAGLLEKKLTEAGFSDVRSEGITVDVALPSAEAYEHYVRDIAAPVRTLLKGQTTERQAYIWRAVAEAAKRYETADGGVRMRNHAICVSGRK